MANIKYKYYLSILKLILVCKSKDELRNFSSKTNMWTLSLHFDQKMALSGNCKGQSTQRLQNWLCL